MKVLKNQLFALPHVPLKDRPLFIGAHPETEGYSAFCVYSVPISWAQLSGGCWL